MDIHHCTSWRAENTDAPGVSTRSPSVLEPFAEEVLEADFHQRVVALVDFVLHEDAPPIGGSLEGHVFFLMLVKAACNNTPKRSNTDGLDVDIQSRFVSRGA